MKDRLSINMCSTIFAHCRGKYLEFVTNDNTVHRLNFKIVLHCHHQIRPQFCVEIARIWSLKKNRIWDQALKKKPDSISYFTKIWDLTSIELLLSYDINSNNVHGSHDVSIVLYCMSKKTFPFLYSKSLYKIEQDFLVIPYLCDNAIRWYTYIEQPLIYWRSGYLFTSLLSLVQDQKVHVISIF